MIEPKGDLDLHEPAIRLEPGAVQILWAVCHDCHKKHPIQLRQGIQQDNELQDWWVKHLGHKIEFRQEDPFAIAPAFLKQNPWSTVKDWFRRLARKGIDRRFAASIPWMLYSPNTNDKIAYAASGNLTFTLAALASSATWVSGRESTDVDNTANLYYDYLLSGSCTSNNGTNVTANTVIEVWLGIGKDDTPHWPSLVTTGLTGSDANVTAASVGVKQNALIPVASIAVPAVTQNVAYDMAPFFIFNGCSPKYWNVVVFQNTGQSLAAGTFTSTGQYGTS